jgi:hypothetical protein
MRSRARPTCGTFGVALPSCRRNFLRREENRRALTGPGGIGDKVVFPVSHLDQRNGSRAFIPPAPFLIPAPLRSAGVASQRAPLAAMVADGLRL